MGRITLRKDKKKRVLKRGESIRADGKYQYKYFVNGKVTFNKNVIIHTKSNGVDGWYNVRGSKLTPGTSSNRVYNNAHGWWYIDNNGKAKGTINGKTATYTVKNSKVVL